MSAVVYKKGRYIDLKNRETFDIGFLQAVACSKSILLLSGLFLMYHESRWGSAASNVVAVAFVLCERRPRGFAGSELIGFCEVEFVVA